MNRIPGMTQQLAGVAVPGQSQTYNQYAIPGQVQQPQTYNPYGQVHPAMAPNPYTTPTTPQQQTFSPYNPAPGWAVPAMAQPGFNSSVAPNPYAPAAAPQIPGMVPGYNPQMTPQQPMYNPAQPQAIPGTIPGYNPVQPQSITGYTASGLTQQPIGISPEFMSSECLLQSQSHYLQNGIPSESEHTYNFLYSSSKTKEEIVDYIKDRDPFYSSQESGGITTYLTIFGIYFVCDNAITNPNFLEAVLKSALIRNYRILDNGYVAFISEIAISCTESITKDSIISFAKYLCQKNYLLTLRKEQFIFTNLGTLLFLDFSNLIPKEYIMGLEKYLTSPTGEVLYQEPSLLFNNVDCLFIDIFKKKYFKRNEIIEIEKRITNFNQLKRGVWR